MGKVAETMQPVVIEDYSKMDGKLPGYKNVGSTVGVPLLVGNRLVGIFTVVSDIIREYDADDLYLLNLFFSTGGYCGSKHKFIRSSPS